MGWPAIFFLKWLFFFVIIMFFFWLLPLGVSTMIIWLHLTLSLSSCSVTHACPSSLHPENISVVFLFSFSLTAPSLKSSPSQPCLSTFVSKSLNLMSSFLILSNPAHPQLKQSSIFSFALLFLSVPRSPNYNTLNTSQQASPSFSFPLSLYSFVAF